MVRGPTDGLASAEMGRIADYCPFQARTHILLLKVVQPELQRAALPFIHPARLHLAQLRSSDLPRNRFWQLAKLQLTHALVRRQLLLSEGQDFPRRLLRR